MKKMLLGIIIMTTITVAEAITERIDSSIPTLEYTCRASGNNTLSLHGGKQYSAEAAFNITEHKTLDGFRVVAVEGNFKLTWKRYNRSNKKNSDNVYKIEYLEENPYYQPKRYKGYSQFRNFDSLKTMWGDLLISKQTNKDKFFAHYLFQLGDHIGGTLHLSCAKN